jgi:hypothetical protein
MMCRRRHISTQLVLGVAVAATLALEALRGSATLATSTAWPLAQELVGVLALVFAWRRPDEQTLPLVLGLGLVLRSGWIAVHLARGVERARVPDAVERGRLFRVALLFAVAATDWVYALASAARDKAQRAGESSSTSLAPNAPPDVNRARLSARGARAR